MTKYEHIEAIELCVRDNLTTYSIKIGVSYMLDYLEYLYRNNYLHDNQYKAIKAILTFGNIGYALFNYVSEEEFRVYVAKPNLFGYTINKEGEVTKKKEYIDNYYIDLDTGEKKEYFIIPLEEVQKYDFDFGNEKIVPIPYRALSDENGQEYFEFLNIEQVDLYKEQFNLSYKENIDKLSLDTSDNEKMTWAKQEAEARAWVVDNTASTPLIDGILSERSKYDKTTLVSKIIEKADAYATAVGKLTGIRQHKEDTLSNGN